MSTQPTPFRIHEDETILETGRRLEKHVNQVLSQLPLNAMQVPDHRGTVYLSGPITGLEYKEARYAWRKEFAEMLSPGITILSPMRHEGHLAEMTEKMSVEALAAFEKENGHLFSHHDMIVAKDRLDIEQCDIMFVNLLGAEAVSQGTIWEMGYAAGQRKLTIVAVEPGNVHKSPFIRQGNIVVGSLHEAALIINSLTSTGL